MLLCVDPGHGGRDPGAVAPTGEREADLVLAVGMRISDLLFHESFLTRVALTGWVSLKERVRIANASRATHFLSIHCNAVTSPAAHGWEVFWEDEKDLRLARLVRDAWQEEFPWQKLRGDQGVKHESESPRRRLGVLRPEMPACLVELGFISNSEELRFIKTEVDRIAETLIEGVSRL